MSYANTILCRVVCGTVLPKAVGNMYLAEAYSWAALSASVIPPAVDKGGIEVALVVTTVVAASPHRRAAMVVTLTSLWPGGDEIRELTPRDGKVIRLGLCIKISIHTILYVAMVNPDVLRFHQLNVVAGRDVVCSGTKQRQIAEDAVLPVLAIEEPRIVGIVVMRTVVERRTWQSIDGTVLHLVIAQLLLNLDFTDDEDGH